MVGVIYVFNKYAPYVRKNFQLIHAYKSLIFNNFRTIFGGSWKMHSKYQIVSSLLSSLYKKLINMYTLIRACRLEENSQKNKHVYMFIRKGRVVECFFQSHSSLFQLEFLDHFWLFGILIYDIHNKISKLDFFSHFCIWALLASFRGH